jgi:hypothetical protein
MKGNGNLEATNLRYRCSPLPSNCGSLGSESTDFFHCVLKLRITDA